MMRKKALLLLVLTVIILPGTDGWARDLGPGTMSLGASSNALFYYLDSSEGYDQKGLDLSVEFGYFMFKNIEIGSAVVLSFGETDHRDTQQYALMPFVAYHWVLNQNAHLYGRIGGGYGIGKADSDRGCDSDLEYSSVYVELGYEYFITENVSLGLAIKGEQIRSERESDECGYEYNETLDEVTTNLKLKFYF